MGHEDAGALAPPPASQSCEAFSVQPTTTTTSWGRIGAGSVCSTSSTGKGSHTHSASPLGCFLMLVQGWGQHCFGILTVV